MRILVVPDKFKGSLTALQAAQAIRRGLLKQYPKARIMLLPLSDGGEGFVDCLSPKIRHLRSIDPMGQACSAKVGLRPKHTAICSIAEASGYWRVPAAQRNPGKWSTEGTGILLRKLSDRGHTNILVGFGGSITNDGGIGLAAPFGYRFLNRHGRDLPLNGDSMAKLVQIIAPDALPNVRFIAATDVENPLYGPLGAAFQFGKQKGASPSQIRRLDDTMKRLSEIAEGCLGLSFHEDKGAGAAGGAAYGLMTFLGAKRVSGFDLFSEYMGLEALVKKHDLVVTGEGCLDETSRGGKGPWAVGQLAHTWKKPVLALCGLNRLKAAKTPFAAIHDLVSLAPDSKTAQDKAAFYLSKAAALPYD